MRKQRTIMALSATIALAACGSAKAADTRAPAAVPIVSTTTAAEPTTTVAPGPKVDPSNAMVEWLAAQDLTHLADKIDTFVSVRSPEFEARVDRLEWFNARLEAGKALGVEVKIMAPAPERTGLAGEKFNQGLAVITEGVSMQAEGTIDEMDDNEQVILRGIALLGQIVPELAGHIDLPSAPRVLAPEALRAVEAQIVSGGWTDHGGVHTSWKSATCHEDTKVDLAFQCDAVATDGVPFHIDGTVGPEGTANLASYWPTGPATQPAPAPAPQVAPAASAPKPASGKDCFGEADLFTAIADYDRLYGVNLGTAVTGPEMIESTEVDCDTGQAGVQTSDEYGDMIVLDRVNGKWTVTGVEASG